MRSTGEARQGACARRQVAMRVHLQDARADKIGKVEGIEEGMCLFPSMHGGGMWTHCGDRRGKRRKTDVTRK